MEHQKIFNLLIEASDSKFVKRKQNTANDQSNTNYDARNETIHNTKVLRSNLCNYNVAYILAMSDIIIIAHAVTQVAFKNCPPLTK